MIPTASMIRDSISTAATDSVAAATTGISVASTAARSNPLITALASSLLAAVTYAGYRYITRERPMRFEIHSSWLPSTFGGVYENPSLEESSYAKVTNAKSRPDRAAAVLDFYNYIHHGCSTINSVGGSEAGPEQGTRIRRALESSIVGTGRIGSKDRGCTLGTALGIASDDAIIKLACATHMMGGLDELRGHLRKSPRRYQENEMDAIVKTAKTACESWIGQEAIQDLTALSRGQR